MSIYIRAKKTLIYLLSIQAILVLLHIIVNIILFKTGGQKLHGITHLFNLFEEHNFPTYFSTFILLSSSCLLMLIYYIKKNNNGKYKYQWLLLSLIFFYLSLDEFIELHERLSAPIQKILHVLPNSLEYWGWTIPYTILFIILALYFIRFYFSLEARFRILFFISAFLFVFGALGFELLEGSYLTSKILHVSNATKQDAYAIMSSIPYFIMVTIEEIFEMTGIIIFIYSLIEYIKKFTCDVNLKFN